MSKIDKKLAAKIKAAPAKLLKDAITGLSSFLTSNKSPGKAISMGKSKEDAGVNFLNSINHVIEGGNAAEMPTNVIDFYNKYFVDDETPKTETPKKETPKKEKESKKKKIVERDSFNFVKDSNHSKLAVLLSKTPTKMGDVKKTMGNSYYSLMAKNEKVFAKDAAGQWYVIGSPAEKLIISQKDVDVTASKVVAEKKAKKEAAAAKKKEAAAAKKKEAIDKKKADVKIKKDADVAKKADTAASAAAKKIDDAGKKKKKKKK